MMQADVSTAIGSKRKGWAIALLALVCVPVVIVSAMFHESMNSVVPESMPFPSTYNKKMSGSSALYELCEKVGLKCSRWELPYRQLTERNVHGTLVIISPWQLLTDTDIKYLERWMKQGNDLVYIDDFGYRTGTDILDATKLHARYRGEVKDANIKAASVPETANTPTLKLTADAVLTGGNAIAGEDKAAYLAWTMWGKGRCLIGTVPDFCANKYIADPSYKNNFQFVVNWLSASKGPIIFDEKCHGFSAADNAWYYILHSPVGFVILQLLFVTLVALVSLNQRFGQPVPVSNARKISNLEFIEGLASTYERARARDTAWSMIYAPFHAKLCKMLGVAPDAPLEQLSIAWAEQSGKNESEVRGFLTRAQQALEQKSLTDQELGDLVRTADGLAGDAQELKATRKLIGA